MGHSVYRIENTMQALSQIYLYREVIPLLLIPSAMPRPSDSLNILHIKLLAKSTALIINKNFLSNILES